MEYLTPRQYHLNFQNPPHPPSKRSATAHRGKNVYAVTTPVVVQQQQQNNRHSLPYSRSHPTNVVTFMPDQRHSSLGYGRPFQPSKAVSYFPDPAKSGLVTHSKVLIFMESEFEEGMLNLENQTKISIQYFLK